MNAAFLATLLPILVVSFALWGNLKSAVQYGKRRFFLLVSVLSLFAAGLAMIPTLLPFQIVYDRVLILFSIISFFYFCAFLFLEYSIHILRIENSYIDEDFKADLKTLYLFIAGLLVCIVISIAVQPIKGNRVVTESLTIGILALIIEVAVFAGSCFFAIGKLFNIQQGIIRRSFYSIPLLLLSVVVASIVIGNRATTASVLPSWAFLIANITYLIRLLEEYSFRRTKHLMDSVSISVTEQERRNELFKQVMVSPAEEDIQIVKNSINNSLAKAKKNVIVADHNITGVVLYTRKGDIFSIDRPELIMGYCTPLSRVDSIKRVTSDARNGMIMKQEYSLKQLADITISESDDRNFGDRLVHDMLRTREMVTLENIPDCYRGLQELICLVPIIHQDDFQGFLIIFKDSCSRLFPEEIREINTLVKDLNIIFSIIEGKAFQKERNRLQGEMTIAQNIQTSIIPRSITIPGYEVSSSMTTATEVGGDVFDVTTGKFGNFINIGDVSGHGLPAGIMSLIQASSFHTSIAAMDESGQELSVSSMYNIANHVLCRLNRDRIGSDKFMTANFVVEKDGNFIHAGAHEAAVLYSASTKTAQELGGCSNRTAFLGIVDNLDSESSVGTFSMSSGDIIVFYTDGLIEAKNADSEQFGIDRIKRILCENSGATTDELQKLILETVTAFAQEGDLKHHNGSFADDISVLVMRRT